MSDLNNEADPNRLARTQSIYSFRQFNDLVGAHDFVTSTTNSPLIQKVPVYGINSMLQFSNDTSNNLPVESIYACNFNSTGIGSNNRSSNLSDVQATCQHDQPYVVVLNKPHKPLADDLKHLANGDMKPKQSDTNRVKKIVVRVKSLNKNQRPIAPKLVPKTSSIDGDSNLSSPSSLNMILSSLRSTESLTDNPSPRQTLENKQPVTKSKKKSPYGYVCISQSIDKLKSHQINYLKMTNHLDKYMHQIKEYFHLNLNEQFKLIYIHGPEKYTCAVKNEIEKLLDRLKYSEFQIDMDLAKYLRKPFAIEKLRQFLHCQTIEPDDFCHYEICDNNPSVLGVYTSLQGLGNFFYEYVLENIQVNYKLNLKNKVLIDMIKDYEPDSPWAVFYYRYFNGIVDYRLVEEFMSESEGEETSSQDGNIKIFDFDNLYGSYFLELTGFKDDIQRFCAAVKEIFDAFDGNSPF
jgi:hypothetical protein